MINMNTWLLFFIIFYLFCLIISSRYALKSSKIIAQADQKNNINSLAANSHNFLNIGVVFGILTYAATLFSTFTLMGIPDFFRVHGLGAWLFIGVTDVAMAFLVIFIGLRLRRQFRLRGCFNVTELLRSYYNGNAASFIFLSGIFVFLIPYVAIQIQGISSFLSIVIDIGISANIWAFAILFIILLYCLYGGFRAIIYNDAIQAIFLLLASWTVALVCLGKAGGLEQLFKSVAIVNPELLTTPGPKGLFNWQFLLSSFLAIAIMPVTQPQLTARIVAMKSTKALRIMAPSLAFFAIIIIFPAVILGMYGAVHYSDNGATEFLKGVLITEQSSFVGALVIIGLISAAMSTADSQIFALSSESENFFISNNAIRKSYEAKKVNANIKRNIFIISFVLLTFIFCIMSKSELVLLARVSFVGTSIAAPMVLLAVFAPENLRLKIFVPIATAISMAVYLASLFTDFVPNKLFDFRLELVIYIFLGIIVLLLLLFYQLKYLKS